MKEFSSKTWKKVLNFKQKKTLKETGNSTQQSSHPTERCQTTAE